MARLPVRPSRDAAVFGPIPMSPLPPPSVGRGDLQRVPMVGFYTLSLSAVKPQTTDPFACRSCCCNFPDQRKALCGVHYR